MKPTHHVMLSTGVSAVFASWVHSWEAILACFLSGIFIDLDHHFDYLIIKKELPISYKKLLDFLTTEHDKKLYLFLHSYELIILLWFSIFVFHLSTVWLGVAVGVSTHIFCDELANPFKPMAYFFVSRMKVGFNRRAMFKEEYFKNDPKSV